MSELLLLVLLWVTCQGQGHGQRSRCGGLLTGRHGVIQTPHFPRRFAAPLRCRWVIDSSHVTSDVTQSAGIVVYLTQLFVTSGLWFTEFDYFEDDSTFQLGGREIHRVTEQNVTSVGSVSTSRPYLVVDFLLDRLEGNHLRALDGLLDVYGFNMTFEVGAGRARTACSVLSCSLSGHCYADRDYREYYCDCFRGFSGTDCSKGPLCQPATDLCENGATCRQVGATASSCVCPEGFTGARCEVRLNEHGCTDQECTEHCPEDSSSVPCSCGQRGSNLTNDRARYEGTIRVTNVSAVCQCLENVSCSLITSLTKQMMKYLMSSNLSVMEDLRLLDIGLNGEVRFHFWGGKSEGSMVREALNRLVQRGRLGEMNLVPTHLAVSQEPTLQLQSVRVNHPKCQVRQGDAFVMSCVAQGSTQLTFRWFKDGVFINITRSKRDMWIRVLPLDSTDQLTGLLGVERADPLDWGTYTCQAQDWGYQQCRAIVLEVVQEPQLRVDPMSVTVEKGENVTVKCMSPNELQSGTKFGYSWTKNNALFKMTPGQEFWEDLYPGGSLLRIYNVQRSATYSCHVRSVWRSMRLEVLNQSVVPWCPSDETGVGGVRWERAGPGVVARVECPAQYSGVATRLCLLVERRQARWQTPDFSACLSDKIMTVSNNFHKVTLGYGNTSCSDAVLGVLTSLRDRGVIYPGEGEPAVGLLRRVVGYLGDPDLTPWTWEPLINGTSYFYSVINTLLLHRNFIINHQKVDELHETVNLWTELWGRQTGPGSAHLAYDSLVVDLFRFEEPAFRHGLTLTIPRPTLSYPPWFSARVVVHVENNGMYQNVSSCVGVVVYNTLAHFLPLRYSQVLPNGSEMQYELASDLVTLVALGPLRVIPSLELAWGGRTGWELRCGVTSSPSVLWNLTACRATPVTFNRTVCQCPLLGTVGVVLVKVIHVADFLPHERSPSIVLLGCACCFAQTLLTFALLLSRWWRQHSWLTFLKLQCCASILAAMAIFIYAFSRSLPERFYPATSTSLQAIILVSLSSHLSKVLMIHTEVVYFPNVHHLKLTIIAVMYGVPLLVVLCNQMAQVSMDARAASWWLACSTMAFYTSASCGLLLVLLFTFLHFHVYKRLKSLDYLKNVDTKRAVDRRLGLLHRTAVVFSATVVMSTSSVLYVNYPSVSNQYLFTLSSALLGFLVLVCYVLHCESPVHLQVLTTFSLQPAESSESDSSPLSIFTKEDAEVECEGASSRSKSVRQKSVLGDGAVTSAGPGLSRLITVSERVSEREECEASVSVSPEAVRVCVIASLVVDTPSVVVCSVDVEPCAMLAKSIVSCRETHPQATHTTTDDSLTDVSDQEVDADVMHRICHDLDYLLDGVQAQHTSDQSNIPNILIQNTSL